MWSKEEPASPGWPTRTWEKHWSRNRYTVQKLNTSLIVSFSHIIHTTCSPFFLGWWTSKRQTVGSLVENKIRTQVIYSLFLHPWRGVLYRFCYVDCKDGRGRFLLLARHERTCPVPVLTASSGPRIWYCGTPATARKFTFDWMLIWNLDMFYFRVIACRWNIVYGCLGQKFVWKFKGKIFLFFNVAMCFGCKLCSRSINSLINFSAKWQAWLAEQNCP